MYQSLRGDHAIDHTCLRLESNAPMSFISSTIETELGSREGSHTERAPQQNSVPWADSRGAHRNLESIRAASLLEWGHSSPVRGITMARQPQPSVLEHDKTTAVAPAAGCVDHCPLDADCDTLGLWLPTTFDGTTLLQHRQVHRSTTRCRMIHPSSIIQRITV
jgi:hypothetical protein